MRVRLLSALVCALFMTTPVGAQVNNVKKVFVIVMENHNWSDFRGASNAPYINNTLLPQASHAEQYYNPPNLHPSLPNYLWLEAGTNFGIFDDNDPSSDHQSRTAHLVTQLKNAGISWKTYQEDISGTNCPLTSVNKYAPKHNPFVYFDDVTNTNDPNSAYCIAHVRPFTEMAADLQNNTVAQYVFITPNLCDDGHDSCAPVNDPIRQTDNWLAAHVPAILNSTAYQTGGALFITWDEGEGGDGPIGMIVLSSFAKGGGYSNSIHYTHGSLLRTVQEILGVSLLGDAAKQTDLSDLFGLTNATGPPASITATGGASQSATVKTSFGTAFSATVKDPGNNLLSGVTVKFTAPASGASGTFSGGLKTTTATTNTSGVATASGFTASDVCSSDLVTAAVSGVATPARFSLTNTAGPPASITATGSASQSATVKTSFGTAFSAPVKDAGNNLLSGITVTFMAPANGASGTFSGGLTTTTATTNTSGVATASGFTANSTAGSYTVTAAVSGVAKPANFSLTNTAGPPASITATGGASQSATVKTSFGTAFSATVKDAGNNLLSGVTVTFTAPASGASRTFSGGLKTTTATTNTSGVATASGFTANSTAGSYTVTAAVSGVATPARFSLTNTAGPPASITATGSASQSATVKTSFGTAFSATVKDAGNNQ